ncbi:sodium channel protein Nach-like [Spodoptera frugiperda]|uniref:Sodium channel protein Nach-like n=1 Tax=Spodoptera frugiperda TaxID=7108 RepID=A0A9R0F757_SPOFR|nr:sodium channel protein Nach-like [Spodoptera frugiperda]
MLSIAVKEKPTFKKKRDNYARRLKTKKLIKYLQSELRTSTTHGLPYIANTELHWFERIFWAACFGAACAVMFVLVSAQYTRLVEAPTVNSVEKDYLNWNVSYPTIVLCPMSKIDDEIFADYVNETFNNTGYNLESFYSAIISVSLEALNVLDLLPPPEILKLIKPEDYAKIAADLFKKFKNKTLTTMPKWPITIDTAMTEMGMCHIINSNVAILDDPTKWSDSSVAYAKNNIELSVHDMDFFVQILNYANVYKVYTLSPDEVILSGTPALTFESEGFLSFGVQITSTRASEDLKYIPLQLRKCRFMHETTTKRYPIYSYNRCLMDCRIKMIFKLCNCIPHFYKPLDHETICNLAELECVLEYKKEIMKLSIDNETMERFDNTDDLPRSFRDCGCLGNCEEDVFKNDHEQFVPTVGLNRMRLSVSAFPKVRVRREIIFSFYDLFLRSGGVVNLCIGTSVISIMELILTAVRIPIYEIMQIGKGIWRRYKKSKITRFSNKKKQI